MLKEEEKLANEIYSTARVPEGVMKATPIQDLDPAIASKYDPEKLQAARESTRSAFTERGVHSQQEFIDYMQREAESKGRLTPNAQYRYQDNYQLQNPELWKELQSRDVPPEFVQEKLQEVGGVPIFGVDGIIGAEAETMIDALERVQEKEPEGIKLTGRGKALHLPATSGNPPRTLNIDDLRGVDPEQIGRLYGAKWADRVREHKKALEQFGEQGYLKWLTGGEGIYTEREGMYQPI